MTPGASAFETGAPPRDRPAGGGRRPGARSAARVVPHVRVRREARGHAAVEGSHPHAAGCGARHDGVCHARGARRRRRPRSRSRPNEEPGLDIVASPAAVPIGSSAFANPKLQW
jgi:hypothetical protein